MFDEFLKFSTCIINKNLWKDLIIIGKSLLKTLHSRTILFADITQGFSKNKLGCIALDKTN